MPCARPVRTCAQAWPRNAHCRWLARSTPMSRAWPRRAAFARCTCRAAGVAANSLGLPDLGISTHGRRADRHPPHHRCLCAAAAGGCGYRLGRCVQHRPHRARLHQGRRRRGCTWRIRCRPSAVATVRASSLWPSTRWSIVSRRRSMRAPMRASSSWRAPMRSLAKDSSALSSAPWPVWRRVRT